MASERPEYNEKIRLMVALAPVAFMKNLPNTYLQALAKNEIILEVIKVVYVYSLFATGVYCS